MLALASKFCLPRVVTGAMPHTVARSLRYTRHFDLNVAELRPRRALRRIISQQILRAQFVADFAKRLVQIPRGGRVIILPTRIVRELDQGVLAAGFASSAALDGNDDDRVDN